MIVRLDARQLERTVIYVLMSPVPVFLTLVVACDAYPVVLMEGTLWKGSKE